jgi:hypothetical protein
MDRPERRLTGSGRIKEKHMAKKAKPVAAVTIINEGSEPIALYPHKLKTRLELHPGEKITLDSKQLVIEPTLVIARTDA